jgi:polysaccharide biosynthesis transport protein
VEVIGYLAPLRRWWWLLVISTLVAMVSTYLSLRQAPPVYETRTTLMVGGALNKANPNQLDVYLGEQLTNTYAGIALRATVRKAVMATLGLDSLPVYTVNPVVNTQLLEITVRDADPRLAQAVANELASQLIEQSPSSENTETQQRTQFIRAQLNDLEVKIQETQDDISKAQADLRNLLSAREIAASQAQIAALQQKLATLQANYAGLLSNTSQGALNALTVVEPADLPASPVGPNKARTLLLVGVIGFLLAAGVAYLLEYLDNTLKGPEDVKQILGLSTLGAVPLMDEAGAGEQPAMLSGQHTAVAEAYRVLRTNLQYASVDQPLHLLLVTSPAPTEGKSFTTANLSIALAQTGQRVVAVDADLHRPRLHRAFGVANSDGLTTALLADEASLDGLLQATSVPGLLVLTAGPTPPNPTELLASARMRELLGQLRAHADILVVDSAPVVMVADAAVLSAQVDGVLLVIDAARTRRDVARQAVASLRAVNAHLLGALLNRVPTRGSGYYYYHYYKTYYSAEGRRSAQVWSLTELLGRLGRGKTGAPSDATKSPPPKA